MSMAGDTGDIDAEERNPFLVAEQLKNRKTRIVKRGGYRTACFSDLFFCYELLPKRLRAHAD